MNVFLVLIVMCFCWNYRYTVLCANVIDDATDEITLNSMAADINSIKYMLQTLLTSSGGQNGAPGTQNRQQNYAQIAQNINEIKSIVTSSHSKLQALEDRIRPILSIENKVDQAISKLDLFQLRMEAFEKSIAELAQATTTLQSSKIPAYSDDRVALQNVSDHLFACASREDANKSEIIEAIRNEIISTKNVISAAPKLDEFENFVKELIAPHCVESPDLVDDISVVSKHILKNLEVTRPLRPCSSRFFSKRYCTDDDSIVIQSRKSGSVAFNQNWQTYKNGFGSISSSNFWLGNEAIHQLTEDGWTHLRIILQFFNGSQYWATYTFKVKSEREAYAAEISDYSGNIYDAFTRHNGMKFSTFDVDNDVSANEHCARAFSSGWWFES